MKKMFALVLAVLMVLSLAACAKTPASSMAPASSTATESKDEKPYYNKEGMPIVDQTLVLTCTGRESSGPVWSESMGIEFLKEKTGIQLQCESYNGETWPTQFTLKMSNNDLPDIIFAGFLDRADVNKWGEQGVFANWLDYADLMPNYIKFREEDPKSAAYETAENGAVYGNTFVRPNARSAVNDATFISKKWLKAVGKEVPTTQEELLDVLRAFKTGDPNGNGKADEIPMSFNDKSGFRLNWILRAGFGIYSTNNDFLIQADKDRKVYLADTTEAYKDYLKFLRQLYEEELLDNACFAQTDDEFVQKTKADTVGIWTSWSGLLTSSGRSDADVYKDYAMYAGFTTKYTDEVIFPLYIKAAEGSRTLFTAKSKYPEACARLIDWCLYTEDGYTMWVYGKEGVTFEYIDDGLGNKVPNSDKFADLKNYSSVDEWRAYKVALPGNSGNRELKATDKIIDNMTNEELQKMVDTNNPAYAGTAFMELFIRNNKCEEGFPFLVFTSDEREAIGTKKAEIEEYIKVTRVGFINGTISIDDKWDEYCNTIKSMGIDDIVAIYQQAYDRYQG